MPLHVLLIQGMSIVESNWYADQLLASSPYLRAPICTVTRVSYDYGESVEAVEQAMRSHDYNAIIVCDLSAEQNAFAIGLGSLIQQYVRSGGRVAFPTTEGLNLIPVLKELFDVPWTRSSYGREQWQANPQSAALLSSQFPLANDEQAVNMQFCVKGCSYTNVPQSDRCFEAKQYHDEEEYDEDYPPVTTRSESPVLVAVRSYGNGYVSYFGDVNCELPTAKLVGAFATVPRTRPPCAWETERILRRAIQAKENGNVAFRAGKIEQALSFYNAAQEYLDPATDLTKKEYSKVLGNIAECRLRLNQWSEAVAAATKAISLDPCNAKAIHRRTRAHLMAAGEDIDVLKKTGEVSESTFSLLHELSVKLSERTLPGRNVQDKDKSNREEETSPQHENAERVSINLDPSNTPNSWCNGLEQEKQYEWLVDCYRMRLDDEYCWQGNKRHGSLYDPDHTSDTIVLDFLVFCKLAVARGALPDVWEWRTFLHVAVNHLHCAFEKSDAQDKYGSENYFSAFLSGRSLRFTAKQIYGLDLMGPEDEDEAYKETHDLVWTRCMGDDDRMSFRRTRTVFANVGEQRVWQEFLQTMRRRV
eukprot:TRINITY_DN1487_c0_g1_i1.p2 TRINITY_DN1487_c0_g1~~TRINITY_DN1487_c0_g1_i1.p2  ORF type:complete len:588 (-),score=78.18 TRINITY_DN1487_c0_g1_i1:4154-5917(-)